MVATQSIASGDMAPMMVVNSKAGQVPPTGSGLTGDGKIDVNKSKPMEVKDIAIKEVHKKGDVMWPSHKLRRQRHKQALEAAVSKVRAQSAVLASLGNAAHELDEDGEKNEVVAEVSARLQRIAPCIQAQVQEAFEHGRFCHSARKLVERDVQTMGSAAKHLFVNGIEELRPAEVKHLSRGKRQAAPQALKEAPVVQAAVEHEASSCMGIGRGRTQVHSTSGAYRAASCPHFIIVDSAPENNRQMNHTIEIHKDLISEMNNTIAMLTGRLESLQQYGKLFFDETAVLEGKFSTDAAFTFGVGKGLGGEATDAWLGEEHCTAKCLSEAGHIGDPYVNPLGTTADVFRTVDEQALHELEAQPIRNKKERAQIKKLKSRIESRIGWHNEVFPFNVRAEVFTLCDGGGKGLGGEAIDVRYGEEHCTARCLSEAGQNTNQYVNPLGSPVTAVEEAVFDDKCDEPASCVTKARAFPQVGHGLVLDEYQQLLITKFGMEDSGVKAQQCSFAAGEETELALVGRCISLVDDIPRPGRKSEAKRLKQLARRRAIAIKNVANVTAAEPAKNEPQDIEMKVGFFSKKWAEFKSWIDDGGTQEDRVEDIVVVPKTTATRRGNFIYVQRDTIIDTNDT